MGTENFRALHSQVGVITILEIKFLIKIVNYHGYHCNNSLYKSIALKSAVQPKVVSISTRIDDDNIISGITFTIFYELEKKPDFFNPKRTPISVLSQFP